MLSERPPCSPAATVASQSVVCLFPGADSDLMLILWRYQRSADGEFYALCAEDCYTCQFSRKYRLGAYYLFHHYIENATPNHFCCMVFKTLRRRRKVCQTTEHVYGRAMMKPVLSSVRNLRKPPCIRCACMPIHYSPSPLTVPDDWKT